MERGDGCQERLGVTIRPPTPSRRLGFEVTTELDADRVELTEALRAIGTTPRVPTTKEEVECPRPDAAAEGFSGDGRIALAAGRNLMVAVSCSPGPVVSIRFTDDGALLRGSWSPSSILGRSRSTSRSRFKGSNSTAVAPWERDASLSGC